MESLQGACRALFEAAFPEGSDAWNDAFFALAMPDCLRVIVENGQPLAMLFALPYPIVDRDGRELDARYLYAVTTDAAHRGQGLATRLLREVIGEGYPVFLRPMSPSLFAFYEKAGFSPVSMARLLEGDAAPTLDGEGFQPLTVEEYRAARRAFLTPPYAEPTAALLSLGFLLGGALCVPDEFAAYYEREGDVVYFKEWLGNTKFAPRAATFLGAKRYRLRTVGEKNDKGATPFAMAANCPQELTMLIALD